MNASSKPTIGRHLRGMHQLQSKISNLQTQYGHLFKERQQEITTLITNLDLAALEDPLLIGGLLFVKDKITTKNPIVEAWHDAGKKFLRRTEPKTSSHIAPQKDTHPKQTPASETNHQPPQKYPQPGGA